MVIVYQSNTGFTEEYAKMLAKAEKKKLYELSEAKEQLEKGTKVFYMGPLMAGHIQGVDKAVKCFAVQGVCGVGMSQPGKRVLGEMSRANYVPNAALFYLQGGYAPKKVGWLKRRMINMVTKSLREELQQKGNRRTEEEQKLLEMYVKGGSFVAFQNLDEIRAWMAQNA
jgi:hypothetical protein